MPRQKIVLPWIVGFLLGALLVMIAVPAVSSPSQQSDRQLIESDAAAVVREGTWASQTAAVASGGAYLYNDANSEAVLRLEIAGPTVEILYVAGPGLGTLAIEVDGVVLRTVSTTSSETTYQQKAVIDYLSNETHTLRVYAQAGGVVAIDAFVVSLTPTIKNTAPAVQNSSNMAGPRVPPCQDTDPYIASVTSSGTQASGASLRSSMSYDGRYIAFEYFTGALTPNDTNTRPDIYLHDRQVCQTTLISQSAAGVVGNNVSYRPYITADGRYITFESLSSNLVPNDNNGMSDIFLYDRQLDQLSLISVASDGTQGNGDSSVSSISDDGRFVVFESEATNLIPSDLNGTTPDIFLRDRQSSQTILISASTTGTQANMESRIPRISGNGQYVVFYSRGDNLVSNDTNYTSDVFLRDLQSNETSRINLTSTGQQSIYSTFGIPLFDYAAPFITTDGRFVAFHSVATDLVPNDTNDIDVFVRDRQNNTTTLASVGENGLNSDLFDIYYELSRDGHYLTWSASVNSVVADTNNDIDVFMRDLIAGTTIRVSVTENGEQVSPGNFAGDVPSMSGNGRYVAFVSQSSLIASDSITTNNDLYVADLTDETPPSTATPTPTSTATQTDTPTPTSSASPTDTPTPTATSTSTNTRTPTSTSTASPTNTRTNTPTRTPTITPSATTVPQRSDTLALFRTDYAAISLISSLADLPPVTAYNSFNLNAPAAGQFVMGDWNGDGLKTPGVYDSSGVFFYTNTLGPTTTWSAIWIGLSGRPAVAGRFNGGIGHDCIGAVDSANFPPYGKAFALYFTCDLTPATAPFLTFQWLSVVLPDNHGYTGTHQFAAGDWNGDGVDSVAIRRGAFIAFTDVAPTTLLSQFNRAQYWGTPPVTGSNEGVFLAGNWNLDNTDSFGVFYANGNFYRRDDLDWNSGVYILQRVGQPIGTPVIATSWRQQ